jgi:hypothetical protein
LSNVSAGGGTAEQAEDDYLNEVMASSEAELAVYQQIDAQYERERVEKWRALHGTLGEWLTFILVCACAGTVTGCSLCFHFRTER